MIHVCTAAGALSVSTAVLKKPFSVPSLGGQGHRGGGEGGGGRGGRGQAVQQSTVTKVTFCLCFMPYIRNT